MRKREYVAMVLVAGAAAGFLLAVLSTMTTPFMGVDAESYSRACSNLALVAIALGIWFRVPKDA